MKIPEKFIIHQTEHWQINHRIDSILRGLFNVKFNPSSKRTRPITTISFGTNGIFISEMQQELKQLTQPQRC